MTNYFQRELKRPIPIALTAIAAVGWILLVAVWLSYSSDLSRAEAQLTNRNSELDQVKSDLDAQKQVAGNLADLRIQNEVASSELSAAKEKQVAADADLEQLSSRLAELEGSISSKQEMLNQIQDESKATDEQLRSRQSELEDAEAGIATQTQALREIGDRVEAARGEEQKLRQNVADLSQEAARLSKEAAGAEGRVQEARAAEATTQEELQAARLEFSRIAEQRTELQKELETLSARRDALSKDVSAAEEQRKALQGQVTELASNLERRSTELAEIEQRIQKQQFIGSHANGADNGEGISPGEYQAGPMQAYFASDGTFRMTNSGAGHNVTGRYVVRDNLLTLDDAVGDTGEAFFPMHCAVEPQPNGFVLTETEGSCSILNAVSFVRTE